MQNGNIGEAAQAGFEAGVTNLESRYFISLDYDSDGAYIQVEDSDGGLVVLNPQVRGEEAKMLYAQITYNPEVSFEIKKEEV